MISSNMPLWSVDSHVDAAPRHWLLTFRQKLKSIQVIVAILVLHALLFYALQQGMFRQIIPALPTEIFATFIAADTPAHRPSSHPAKPKTVNLVTTTTASPVNTAVNITLAPEPGFAPPASEEAPTTITLPSAPLHIARSEPKTISSGVEYLQAPRPVYPVLARRLHEEGKTLLRVLINEQGLPEKAEVQQSSGSTRLDDAARVAVLGALFKPYLENGKPMAVYALVPIRFQLNA